MEPKGVDIEERLIDFSVSIIDLTEKLPNSNAVNYLSGQLIRSGTSPALHYGEAKVAESRADFIHKMKVCLKELRETLNGLRIIKKSSLYNNDEVLDSLIKECNELISIFVSSINTASNKNKS
jgi:four helix bundle protein